MPCGAEAEATGAAGKTTNQLIPAEALEELLLFMQKLHKYGENGSDVLKAQAIKLMVLRSCLVNYANLLTV